jgi:hypothetical protein
MINIDGGLNRGDQPKSHGQFCNLDGWAAVHKATQPSHFGINRGVFSCGFDCSFTSFL